MPLPWDLQRDDFFKINTLGLINIKHIVDGSNFYCP